MPKITEHKEMALRRVIRDAMAIDPLITVSGLQRVVESKTGRPIDELYVKKLLRKVTGEMVIVADRERYEKRISQLRERNRILIDELLRIAYNASTSPKDKVNALGTIARIENAQVKLEMDLGLFTRHI